MGFNASLHEKTALPPETAQQVTDAGPCGISEALAMPRLPALRGGFDVFGNIVLGPGLDDDLEHYKSLAPSAKTPPEPQEERSRKAKVLDALPLLAHPLSWIDSAQPEYLRDGAVLAKLKFHRQFLKHRADLAANSAVAVAREPIRERKLESVRFIGNNAYLLSDVIDSADKTLAVDALMMVCKNDVDPVVRDAGAVALANLMKKVPYAAEVLLRERNSTEALGALASSYPAGIEHARVIIEACISSDERVREKALDNYSVAAAALAPDLAFHMIKNLKIYCESDVLRHRVHRELATGLAVAGESFDGSIQAVVDFLKVERSDDIGWSVRYILDRSPDTMVIALARHPDLPEELKMRILGQLKVRVEGKNGHRQFAGIFSADLQGFYPERKEETGQWILKCRLPIDPTDAAKKAAVLGAVKRLMAAAIADEVRLPLLALAKEQQDSPLGAMAEQIAHEGSIDAILEKLKTTGYAPPDRRYRKSH